MREQLEQSLARYEELERQMLDPEVQLNGAKLSALAREQSSITKMATRYRSFKQVNEQIRETNEMIAGNDSEMRELAEAELPELRAKREQLWNELLDLTIGGEDANRSKIVIE